MDTHEDCNKHGPDFGEDEKHSIDAIIRRLEWDDTRDVEFDPTMIFGFGYDYSGIDDFRLEAKGRMGNYAVWPESSSPRTYSLYRDSDGAFAYGEYDSYEEAQAAAERWDSEDA
jgi:hypothetical protein